MAFVVHFLIDYFNVIHNNLATRTGYVAELKEPSRTCAFGVIADGVTLTSQLILDENLRYRFVCGLEDVIIQRRLLSEDNLSYEKAVKIASAMELAKLV